MLTRYDATARSTTLSTFDQKKTAANSVHIVPYHEQLSQVQLCKVLIVTAVNKDMDLITMSNGTLTSKHVKPDDI